MSDDAGPRAGTFLLIAATLTALAIAAVFCWPGRLGADDWSWRLAEPAWWRTLYALVPLGLLGALATASWRRVREASRAGMAGLVVLLIVMAFLVQVGVGQQGRGGYHESLFAIGLRGSSSYHLEARMVTQIGPHLRGYEREVRRRPFRVQLSTHPAGPVVLFWCLNQVFAGDDARAQRFVRSCEGWLALGVRLEESPDAAKLFASLKPAELAGLWLSTLVLRLAAALVVVPVYLLAGRWHGRVAGLEAAALAAAIPSLVLFSPIVDQCFPVLAATACWLGFGAGERRSGWRAALAGLTVSLGLLFTLAFAVVGVWAGLLAVVGLGRSEAAVARRDVARLAAGAAAGFLVPVALLAVAFGYNSFAVWWACWEGNAEFNRLTQRTYWKWVLLNPVEFLAFLGVPVACLFVRRLVGEVGGLWRRVRAGRDWPTLAVAALVVALNVLGANLGEVARLWMFLMPACVVAAAAELERFAPLRRVSFVALFALQGAQVVLFRAGLDVVNIF